MIIIIMSALAVAGGPSAQVTTNYSCGFYMLLIEKLYDIINIFLSQASQPYLFRPFPPAQAAADKRPEEGC